MQGGQNSQFSGIAAGISEATGQGFEVASARSIGGGCINEALRLEGDGQRYFVKLNRADQLAMFEAEAAGLEAIVATNTLRAPRPIAWGIDNGQCWLALEWIEFGRAGSQTSEQLGEQLAAMHRVTAEAFGWHRDNTIGATEQVNTWTADWVDFLGQHRLDFQLKLADQRGAPPALLERGQRLIERLPAFFEGYKPAPSLLHGDLWGGNWAPDATGAPVIFDPAIYHGDREADLAMTELFGGFDDRFYQSYRLAWPWDSGYPTRKVLYNLYHVLNHYHLFGGGYAGQARDMIEQLLAQV